LKGYKDFWVKHVFESRVLKAGEKCIEEQQRSDKINYVDVLNYNYQITSASLSESDLKAAVHVAWNTFYSLKKVSMKKY
jgi:hypothetical protein